MSVCLSTALYEKTYQHFIDNDKLRGWIKKLNYKFDEIIILFNNISDEGKEKCVEYLNSIDENISYSMSDDHRGKIVETFGVDPNVYSIANFSQLILCNSEYILYICEDISVVSGDNFILDSIDIINSIEECLVTSMNCSAPGCHPSISLDVYKREIEFDGGNAKPEEADTDSQYKRISKKNGKFYATNSFGDHIYFSSRKNLMAVDYNTTHPVPGSRFPSYSGESFDKRINHYMWNNELYNYKSKDCYYSHIGWPYYLGDR